MDQFIGNNAVGDREFCPTAPTGACCDAGTCLREPATELECQVFGGGWFEGVDCASVCP